MASFTRVLQDYQCSDESHGPDALMFAILKLGIALGNEDGDVNPCRDVYAQLDAAGVGKIALDFIRARLHTLESRYDQR